jgi:hypothetical protein
MYNDVKLNYILIHDQHANQQAFESKACRFVTSVIKSVTAVSNGRNRYGYWFTPDIHGNNNTVVFTCLLFMLYY